MKKVPNLVLILAILTILVPGVTLYIQSQSKEAISQVNSGITVNVYCIEKIDKESCTIGGVVVKTPENVEIARQTSTNNGKFNIQLKPGNYLITPMAGSQEYPVINFEPRSIAVTEGKFSEIEISYWTGRR